MGIPTLWPHLYETCERTTKDQLAIKAFCKRNTERTLRLGVDAPMWFAHASTIPQGGANPVLRMLYDRLAHYFAHGISLLFVFDGSLKPAFKRGQHVGNGRVAFKRTFVQAIEAFGFQWVDAPGEAEAELAYLSQTNQIDFVLSDDIDTLLFGARKVMRNPSKNLSGNEALTKRNKSQDGEEFAIKMSQKATDAQIVLYDSEAIEERLDLTKGGLILIGLMSGGDYDTSGLKGCGTVISLALAKAGFGDQLLAIYQERTSEGSFKRAVADWREELKDELRTNSRGYLPSRRKALADDIPTSFPDLALLASYADPATTKSLPNLAQDLNWQQEPDLPQIVHFLQDHLELTYNDIYKKLPQLYRGLFFYIARQTLIRSDRQCKSSLPKIAKIPFVPSASTSKEPLFDSICSRRTSDNTGGLYEYRVNVNPSSFHSRISNLFVGEDVNIGKAEVRKAEEKEAERRAQSQAGIEVRESDGVERQSRVVDPEAVYREWVPAALVKTVAVDMKEEYEKSVHQKEVDKAEALKRKEARARGEKVPRASPAKKKTPKTVEVESSPAEQPAPTRKKKAQVAAESALDVWEMQDTLARYTRIQPVASTSRAAVTALSDSDLELLTRNSPPKSPKKSKKHIFTRQYEELSDDDLPSLDSLPPATQKPIQRTLSGKVALAEAVPKKKRSSPPPVTQGQSMLSGFKTSKATVGASKPKASIMKAKIVIELSDSD